MRILLNTPLKPIDHNTPSGDLAIATDIMGFFREQGHQVHPIGKLKTRWLYWKPWLWPALFSDCRRNPIRARQWGVDAWLTYHSYYKAPDIAGLVLKHRTGLPYFIYEASYATAKRKRFRTAPGFYLNKAALASADHVFTNRMDDLANIKRILPEERLTHIVPGICPERFTRSEKSRRELRESWGVRDETVIITAAMFRPGVKYTGVVWSIRACARLLQNGRPVKLVVIGDGRERHRLEELAAALNGHVHFTGRLPRNKMRCYFSAGDVFAFPGFQESLGMVFLEAQSCGLPVVAMREGGIPEVVYHGKTGLLSPSGDFESFYRSLEVMADSEVLRKTMGDAAIRIIRQHHDININYQIMEATMTRIVQSGKKIAV